MLINNKGQSLLEAVIALSAAVIVLSAIVVAVISAVNNTDYAKDQATASSYVQSELEYLVSLSKIDWTVFAPVQKNPRDYCVEQDGKLNACDFTKLTPNMGKFTRTVNITAPDDSGDCNGSTKIEVQVSWTDSRCGVDLSTNKRKNCHSIINNTCVSESNLVPTVQ